MGVSTSSARAASGALHELKVLVVQGGDGSGVADLVSLLQSSGISTSTVTQADLGGRALDELDAIVLCDAATSSTAKLASEIRLQDSSPRLVAVLWAAEPKELRELLAAGVD